MADVTVLSAKVPLALAAKVEGLAATRLVSVSALVRRALEHEMAASEVSDDVGPVELAARAEIVGWGLAASETRVAAALNLARRLDTDPTNGATHARELRALLDDLGGSVRRDFGVVDELQAKRILRMRGWRLISPDGREVGS